MGNTAQVVPAELEVVPEVMNSLLDKARAEPWGFTFRTEAQTFRGVRAINPSGKQAILGHLEAGGAGGFDFLLEEARPTAKTDLFFLGSCAELAKQVKRSGVENNSVIKQIFIDGTRRVIREDEKELKGPVVNIGVRG